MPELIEQIELLLKAPADREATLQKILGLALAHFQSESGTIHVLDPEHQTLHLIAQVGLPPPVVEVVKLIPVGKGIAGQVIARGGPVTICNLQTDTSGVAKPGARQTGMGGALCVPVRKGNDLVGTIGIGTVRQYEYTPGETRLLEDIGRRIGVHVSSK